MCALNSLWRNSTSYILLKNHLIFALLLSRANFFNYNREVLTQNAKTMVSIQAMHFRILTKTTNLDWNNDVKPLFGHFFDDGFLLYNEG